MLSAKSVEHFALQCFHDPELSRLYAYFFERVWGEKISGQWP
jgi:hypothetical protein